MNNVSEYIVYGYSGRSIATVYSNDLAEISEKTKNGWKYELVEGNFWLRAPEIWLVNIADPQKVFYYGNAIINLAYYNFLQKLINTNSLIEYVESVIKRKRFLYKSFSFVVSTGAVQEADIRIIGRDSRIYNLKNDLFQNFFLSKDFEKCYREAGEVIPLISQQRIFAYRGFNCLNEELKNYYNRIEKAFRSVGYSNVYNSRIIKGIKEQLPEYDYLVFVPTSCFGYISSFISSDNIDNISYIEMHSNKNLKRYLYYDMKKFLNKKVLIIDKCYSGKTLQRVKQIIEDAGGIPITMGLFPNNRYVANSLDYTVVLNKVFDMSVEAVSGNWLINKYTEIFTTLAENEDVVC